MNISEIKKICWLNLMRQLCVAILIKIMAKVNLSKNQTSSVAATPVCSLRMKW